MKNKILTLIALISLIPATLAASATPNEAVAEEAINPILAIVNSKLWENLMSWLNLFVFLYIVYRFILIPLMKYLDRTIADIQQDLHSEESERQRLNEALAQIKSKLNDVEGYGKEIIKEAEVDAKKLYEDTISLGKQRIEGLNSSLEEDVLAYEIKKTEELRLKWCQSLIEASDQEIKGDHNKLLGFEEKMVKAVIKEPDYAA